MTKEFIVDTYKIEQYVHRLEIVGKKLAEIEDRWGKLALKLLIHEGYNTSRLPVMSEQRANLSRCVIYLSRVASVFEKAEKWIKNAKLSDFEEELIYYNGQTYTPEELAELIAQSLSGGCSNLVDSVADSFESAGEGLDWIESEFGELSHEIAHAFVVLIPDELQHAYSIASGIIQGDLTVEEVWEAAQEIVGGNFKLATVLETIEYVFTTAVDIDAEMMAQVYQQLGEGDIIGAIVAAGEGFVDGVIGGSIEILGNVGSGFLNSYMEDIPVINEFNLGIEYITGVLGWNGGDGYSAAGLIGAAAQGVSNGIDAATDFVSDATDFVTDSIIDGVSTGIEWVTSWFD